MTMIFVSSAHEDVACAEQIRQGLEAAAHTTWREPASLSIGSVLYPPTIENAILASAAVVLVWSGNAAQSAWVERHLLFAQSLKKQIIPVLRDATGLPVTLLADVTIAASVPCADVASQLMPHLPAPDSTDAFLTISEKAAHEFIRERKEAIALAAQMLTRNEQREAVLAVLEYLAQNDLMMGVRDAARKAIEADAQKATPAHFTSLRPEDARYMLGVRCKNGHVSYFDKRRVCKASSSFKREVVRGADRELDELHLPCDTNTCNEIVVARVDCRDYR